MAFRYVTFKTPMYLQRDHYTVSTSLKPPYVEPELEKLCCFSAGRFLGGRLIDKILTLVEI